MLTVKPTIGDLPKNCSNVEPFFLRRPPQRTWGKILFDVNVAVSLENTGEVKWIDTSAVHTTCLTYQDAELRAVAKRDLSTAVAGEHAIPDVLVQDPSPTLISREQLKNEKYARLVMVATKQHADGKRASLPKFSPFVVSDFGELAPAVDQYRVKLKKAGRRDDGCSSSELVRQFRHKFKVSVQLAIASGLGAMIQAAGQPWVIDFLRHGTRVYSVALTRQAVSVM